MTFATQVTDVDPSKPKQHGHLSRRQLADKEQTTWVYLCRLSSWLLFITIINFLVIIGLHRSLILREPPVQLHTGGS